MILEKAIITDTGKPLHLCSCFLGDRGHHTDTIGLEDGLVKGLITDTGKSLYDHLGLLGDRTHLVNMIDLLGRWSHKGCPSLTQGSLCKFVQVSQETEFKLIP